MNDSITNHEAQPRIVLLYRASSKKQTDSENDIPLQRNILRPWADGQGKFICEFVEGGVSGFKVSAVNRDAIIEIKAMADRGEFDILGIFMSDRLGRRADETPLIVAYLNARGVKVVSFCEGEISAKTHTDKLLTYIRYWQAEAESIKNSERITYAMEQNVKEGKWRGGNPPYGYKMVSNGTLNFKGRPIFDVVVDVEAAEVVKEIFSLYKRHYGVKTIAKYLNDNNMSSRRNTLWSYAQISAILKNKLYIGIYELGKKTKVKMISPIMEHLRIITDEDFYNVQKLFKENSKWKEGKRPTIRGSQLLTGLLVCECGQKYTSQINKIAKVQVDDTIGYREQSFYRCGSYRVSTVVRCENKLYNIKELDELISHEIKSFVSEFIKQKIENVEFENWINNFDGSNVMRKKEVLINLIDRIVLQSDCIEVIYKVCLKNNQQDLTSKRFIVL